MMSRYLFFPLIIVFIAGCGSFKTREDVAKLEQELTPQPGAGQTATVATPASGDNSASVAASGDATQASVNSDEEPMTRFSELNNMAPPSDRQYRRMTRKKMEEESELNSTAGSLWKMDGQTSYLFAENRHRQEGDPTVIKMEDSALKLVENKVQVIQDLLKQLEAQRIKAEEDQKKAEEEKARLAQIEEEKKLRAEQIARGEIVVDPMEEEQLFNQQKQEKANDSRKPSSVASKPEKEEKIDLKEIESIPSKIVEKISADTYRIRGQQFLMIKSKPYKVIATALVRAEDFNDNGVSSNKLLDAQYEVVHAKRATE